jgi:hypothetical protein
MTVKTHRQIEAACAQLDRAIRLFLDEHDYYSAATLAGASEGVLGPIAVHLGESEHALKSKVSYIRQGLTDEENNLVDGTSLIADLNLFRDWLKHCKVTADSDGDLEIDAEDAAFELIDRAVTNCVLVMENRTEQMERFRVYSSERYA